MNANIQIRIITMGAISIIFALSSHFNGEHNIHIISMQLKNNSNTQLVEIAQAQMRSIRTIFHENR